MDQNINKFQFAVYSEEIVINDFLKILFTHHHSTFWQNDKKKLFLKRKTLCSFYLNFTINSAWKSGQMTHSKVMNDKHTTKL